MVHSSPVFPEYRSLVAILSVVGLQFLLVRGFSAAGVLDYEWIAALPLAFAALWWTATRLIALDASERLALCEAWKSPGPWMVMILLVLQVILYPPMMADSLCYRLPRMFLALQDGRLSGFATTDYRMATMPWGWESLALPFASLNLIGWSRIIGLACWVVVYQLLFRFGRIGGAGPKAARGFALACATAPFFVLQAPSTANDLLAGTLLLGGVALMTRFGHERSSVVVLGSLLAIVLASNVKPQFLVLGLPWLVWVALAPGRPWRSVSIPLLAAAAPLFLLVSPIPILAQNWHESGSLNGAVDSMQTTEAPAWRMMAAGMVQFGVSQLQLPIVPGSEAISHAIRSLPGMDLLGEEIPKFGPGVGFLPMIDNAGIGLLHGLLLLIGIIVAARQRPKPAAFGLSAIAIAFLIACSQVVVSTMGRSFSPFLVVLVPLAAFGGARLLERRGLPGVTVRGVTVAITLAGVLSLVLNPSAPLWPAALVRGFAERSCQSGLAAQIDRYLAYQQRARTGEGILDGVPEGEIVGILIRQVTPVTALWQPDWRRHRIEYVHQVPAHEFAAGETEWLLVAGSFEETAPDVHSDYMSLDGWRVVESRDYLPNLSQGHDTWRLLTRSGNGS